MKVTKLPSVSLHGVEYARLVLDDGAEVFMAPLTQRWQWADNGELVPDETSREINREADRLECLETHAEFLEARAHAERKGAG